MFIKTIPRCIVPSQIMEWNISNVMMLREWHEFLWLYKWYTSKHIETNMLNHYYFTSNDGSYNIETIQRDISS